MKRFTSAPKTHEMCLQCSGISAGAQAEGISLPDRRPGGGPRLFVQRLCRTQPWFELGPPQHHANSEE